MISTVVLMEVLLVLAAVMTGMVVTTAATADTAFARPIIGIAPPGDFQRNPNSGDNPGADQRTVPETGGQSPRFQE